MSELLRCTCGYRVRPRDVIEGGAAADECGGRVFLRYVCGHCERVASVWLAPDEWDDGAILHDSERPHRGERQELGIITHAEVRRFREALNGTSDSLLALRSAVEPRRRRGAGRDWRSEQPRGPRDL
jgi:hypothetical protein